MTKAEYDQLRVQYDPELLRTAQSWIDREPPKEYSPTIWHHKAQGKEFVIMKCGEDDLRAFVLVDRQGLKNYLGKPEIANRKGTRDL
jgi:hypothetical protein